jgi:tetratricopeptide (TPR) repeat protein
MEKKNNNSSKWPFQILVPHKPEGTEISVKEAEKILLEQLDASNNKQDIEQALWELACFYSKTGRQSIALQYVKQLADGTEDPNKAAACYMAMGQLMEQIHDYESAILFYTQAVLLEPTVTYTAYFINNNLGYSLNRVGKHDEAEKYCRKLSR